jgi:hypothetical protein
MKILNISDKIITALSKLDEAQTVLRREGVDNMTQPGLLKEIRMAEKLNHNLIQDKHYPDAIDDKGNFYEYLSCQSHAQNFAIDCMFSRPEADKQKSLERITRNKKIYCGVFDGIKLLTMYEVPTQKFLEYTEDNLSRRDKNGQSKNREHTINYTLRWVKSVGKKIYEI